MSRFLILDDEPLMCRRIESVLSRRHNVVGVFEKPAELLGSALLRSSDALILDLQMPDMDGLSVLKGIRKISLELKILIFTVFEDPELLIEAMTLGASGFLLKDTPDELFLAEVDSMLLGGAPMTPRVAAIILSRSRKTGAAQILSSREKEIVEMLSFGLNYVEIAERTGLSGHTVRRHIEKIYRKLGAHSKLEAVHEAKRRGLLP